VNVKEYHWLVHQPITPLPAGSHDRVVNGMIQAVPLPPRSGLPTSELRSPIRLGREYQSCSATTMCRPVPRTHLLELAVSHADDRSRGQSDV